MCLALSVLGYESDGRIEARESREAAADETGEHDGVEVRAETNDKREQCGGDSERYLKVVNTWREEPRGTGGSAAVSYVVGYSHVGGRTRSARLSSSWPSIRDSFLQRATFPSRKSKKRPARGKTSADQR